MYKSKKSLAEKKAEWVRTCLYCGEKFINEHPKKTCGKLCKDRYYRSIRKKKKLALGIKRINSTGENKVNELLSQMFIGFEIDLHNRIILPDKLEFDFLIKPDVAIEYDGNIHFKYIPFIHKNLKGFMNRLYNDQKKDLFCKENGIKLVRIRFDELLNYETLFNKLEEHIIGDKYMKSTKIETEEDRKSVV